MLSLGHVAGEGIDQAVEDREPAPRLLGGQVIELPAVPRRQRRLEPHQAAWLNRRGGLLEEVIIGGGPPLYLFGLGRIALLLFRGSAFLQVANQLFNWGFASIFASSASSSAFGDPARRRQPDVLGELGQMLLLVRLEGHCLDLGTLLGGQVEPGLDPMRRLERRHHREVDDLEEERNVHVGWGRSAPGAELGDQPHALARRNRVQLVPLLLAESLHPMKITARDGPVIRLLGEGELRDLALKDADGRFLGRAKCVELLQLFPEPRRCSRGIERSRFQFSASDRRRPHARRRERPGPSSGQRGGERKDRANRSWA